MNELRIESHTTETAAEAIIDIEDQLCELLAYIRERGSRKFIHIDRTCGLDDYYLSASAILIGEIKEEIDKILNINKRNE